MTATTYPNKSKKIQEMTPEKKAQEVGPFPRHKQLPPINTAASQKLSIESEQRPARKTSIEVFPYTPSDIQSEYQLVWSGSIGVFIAKKGSKILARIKEAVNGRKGDDISIAKEITDIYASRPMLDHSDAVDRIIQQDVFADVSYGGRLLFYNGTVLDDVEVCAIGLPYNGGKIYPESFELIEHYKEGSEEELEAIALYRAPALSEAERKALVTIEEDDDWYNVGKHMLCFAASAATVYVTVCAACSLCCRSASFTKRGIINPHIREDLIKKLSPIGTAKELLKIRRDILCN